MMRMTLLLIVMALAACGSADNKPQVESRTECRTDANGRLICVTYKPKASDTETE